ncbi:AbiJ-related protein [Phaeacidiphilus oryzae]|uniref:AbiJ-related protein n=1 Tax=Phaeacidiphilus oryzae TaxID=348818 RepID=UPI00068F817A|nr:hypothetical protein [Phaeacidiphilus oryzae]
MATDVVELRQAVEAAVRGLHTCTHRELTALCPQLALPPLPAEGTKWERLSASLAGLRDVDLPQVAQRILDARPTSISRADLFAVENALWATLPTMEIPGRVRRDLSRALDLGLLIYRPDRFEHLLEQWWILDGDPLAGWAGPMARSLRDRITQHVFRNPQDWTTEDLFEHLGAFGTAHARFSGFLEGLVSSQNVPDVSAQTRIVQAANPTLLQAGLRLEQTGVRDGYPHFQLLPVGTRPRRRPKNLIFASPRKPDIRFLDALDNNIEVLQGADEVLVYDRPIGPEGLTWHDLQDWWQHTSGTSDEEEVKATLYTRLLESMPSLRTSPQRALFLIYHELHGPRVPRLPALLPEVWLHWDPKTVAQRGPDALLHHRMDYLLLLPHGRRVVLEVDGAHHYADGQKYTAGVRGDRELRLSGYDVFRFSSTELTNPDHARPLLREFFTRLFDLYDVACARAHHEQRERDVRK